MQPFKKADTEFSREKKKNSSAPEVKWGIIALVIGSIIGVISFVMKLINS